MLYQYNCGSPLHYKCFAMNKNFGCLFDMGEDWNVVIILETWDTYLSRRMNQIDPTEERLGEWSSLDTNPLQNLQSNWRKSQTHR